MKVAPRSDASAAILTQSVASLLSAGSAGRHCLYSIKQFEYTLMYVKWVLADNFEPEYTEEELRLAADAESQTDRDSETVASIHSNAVADVTCRCSLRGCVV